MARLDAYSKSAPMLGAPKQKPLDTSISRGFLNKSLTITYFHTGCSTIIGAELFHGPVRDGKGWYQPAMVIRHNLYDGTSWGVRIKLGRSKEVADVIGRQRRLFVAGVSIQTNSKRVVL